MNTIDAEVIEILSEPRTKYDKWWVDVRINSWGHKSTNTLMFDTKEEAESIKIGDVVVI